MAQPSMAPAGIHRLFVDVDVVVDVDEPPRYRHILVSMPAILTRKRLPGPISSVW